MKRVGSILLVFCVVLSCILTCSMSVFASSDISETALIPSYNYLEADAKALVDSLSKFVSFPITSPVLTSNLINFWCNALHFIDDVGWTISVFGRTYYLVDGVLKFFDGDIASGHGGGSSEPVDDLEDIYVPSDVISEVIKEDNTHYSPKGKDLFLNSYRTDKSYHTDIIPTSGNSNDAVYNVTLFQNPSTLEGLKDLYCLPFYKAEDGTMYYCDYQLRFYWADNDDPNSDIALKVDTYQYNPDLGYIYDGEHSGIIYEGSSSAIPYQVRACPARVVDATCMLSVVKSELDFSNWQAFSLNSLTLPYYGTKFKFFKSNYSDNIDLTLMSTNYNIRSLFYGGNLSRTDAPYKKNKNINNDYGFICSSSIISTVYNIDSSRIPSGQIIQITGDSNVYNYYMTNPETGQSSTVNEFVENNYTYITNNNGGEGSGSGVSGNVTVDGKVDVNGNINVDVNINQSPAEYPDFDLVENLPEAPQGFLDYLAVMFGFLPSSVLFLLVGGIAAAIFCRIWGR